MEFINYLKSNLSHSFFGPFVVSALVLFSGSYMCEPRTKTVLIEKNILPFESKRILSDRKDSYYKGKESQLAEHTKKLREQNAALESKLSSLEKRLKQIETKPQRVLVDGKPQQKYAARFGSGGWRSTSSPPPFGKKKQGRPLKGPSTIHFPVATPTAQKEKKQVQIPVGSYVKGKLMTGIEAPEGKTLPVLLQLDHAMVGPNESNLDLNGCFIIAKASGDLSTERVQMQATKLSCVSPNGELFEQKINGFVADDKDNSFAVIGKVNSKRMRSAGVGFLASVVEGVGSSIQDRQSQLSVSSAGIAKSITGSRGAYLAAGGASNAASKVTDWYLKQAESLLPTINVGSGQDVWIVMHDSVSIPSHFFQPLTKNKENTDEQEKSIYFRDVSSSISID